MPRRESRSAAACLFCREKKLKCDARRPTCGNCAKRGIDCKQGETPYKPRPTNSRIARLEQENELLRQRCGQMQTETSLTGAGSPSTAATRGSTIPITPERSQVPVPLSRSVASAGDTPYSEAPDSERQRSNRFLYHGPTSTVYDATVNTGNAEENGQSNSAASDVWTRQLLFAQTAKQRQLEPINLAAGILDFDGIDPEIGMHLLSIYWSRQLFTAQIIYRPAFMRDMASHGPNFSKLLLNAIFFTVSKHSSRPELRSDPGDITTAGWRFRQRFTELLRDSFDRSEVTTIQALLIMSNALFSRCDERSLSWLYAGNAFNMIIDLGLHVLSSPTNLSLEELEIRKRVLWGAYSIDKIQCLLQGRPPLLRHANFKASLNFLDEYDEMDPFNSVTYKTDQNDPAIPSLNVSLLTKLCELSIIIERILVEVYFESPKTTTTNPSQTTSIPESIKADLTGWRRNLPPQLDIISSPEQAVLLPQSFCLLALSHVLMILSQRPLITDSFDNNSTNSTSRTAYESLNACASAANQIVQLLRSYAAHFSMPSAPYMLSYATYISATIHARIVAQKGPSSTSYQSLLLCRGILEEHRRLYAAAGKAKDTLDKLIAHLGINVSTSTSSSVGVGGPSAGSLTDGVERLEGCSGSGHGHGTHQQQNSSGSRINVADQAGQTLELGFAAESFPVTWDLSDLDLEAIAQGFQLDGEEESFCFIDQLGI